MPARACSLLVLWLAIVVCFFAPRYAVADPVTTSPRAGTASYIVKARVPSREQERDKSAPAASTAPEPSPYKIISDVRTVAQDEWCSDVLRLASESTIGTTDPVRRILIYVHGYNNDEVAVVARVRSLRRRFGDADFRGVIVALNWPSDNSSLSYFHDRRVAHKVCTSLFDDCIIPLRNASTPEHPVQINLLAHSTGAYLVCEAFEELDRRAREAEKKASSPASQKTAHSTLNKSSNLSVGSVGSVGSVLSALSDPSSTSPSTATAPNPPLVDNVIFIAADAPPARLENVSADPPTSAPLFHQCQRLLNYMNRDDGVLAASFALRAWWSGRMGKGGIPKQIESPRAHDIDCTRHYRRMYEGATTPESWLEFAKETDGAMSHSWYFSDPAFAKDVVSVLQEDRQSTESRRLHSLPAPVSQ